MFQIVFRYDLVVLQMRCGYGLEKGSVGRSSRAHLGFFIWFVWSLAKVWTGRS